MNHWNSQRYLKIGKEQGQSLELLQRAVATVNAIRTANQNVPPLLTLKHLAICTEVPYTFLRSVVARGGMGGERFYKVFTLKKKSVGHSAGRTRTISSPHALLLQAQRWIHQNILVHGEFHEASCAYRPGSKIYEAASLHCDARWMVKLDITNFFESITEQKVYRIFRKFGYQPLVSFELARICTRVRNDGPRRRAPPMERILSYNKTRIGHLPQGAPTSPLIANLVVHDMDVALTLLAQKFDMVYSRYADDITFSTTTAPWSRTGAIELLKSGHAILRSYGFAPNQAKARIVPPGARKIVLGLGVNDSQPRLTKTFKNKLRAHIHYLKRFGDSKCPPHQKLGFDSILGLQRHVFGLAYFAKGIDREWGGLRLAELKEIHWPTDHGISFTK